MNDIEVFFNNLFKLSFKQIIIASIIILIFIFINKLIIDRVIKFSSKIVKKTNSKLDDNIIDAIGKPLKFFTIGLGGYFALIVINIDKMPSDMLSSTKYLKIIIIITICMFLYNLTLENSILHHNSGTDINEEKKVVFPFIAIILRVLIIVIAVIMIANEFGLTGFLTGLGISGVVVAFAAQDTCSNLFGGMMIVLDKPFALGDWIKTGDIEGIVEEITFRSTRIRTFCRSLVTVPNTKLTNDNIINYSKRNKWQVVFKITLDIETSSENIEKAVERIKQIIQSKDEVDKEMIIVNFTEINLNGYEIFIYFYTEMVNFFRYQEIKEEINIAIVFMLDHYKIKLSRNIFNDLKNQ